MLHISIKAEKLFEIFGFPVTNSLIATEIVLIAFFVIAVWYKNHANDTASPFVFFIRWITYSLYRFFESILHDKTKVFFSFLSSLFLFIILSNWFGLLPGVESIVLKKGEELIPLLRGTTADLNVPLALAFVAFIAIQWSGIRYAGLRQYLKKFINIKNPMTVFVGLLDIISEFSKIISFSFRLFGNIFAGEVLIAVIAFLIPVLASFPFLMLEIFVGFIQALVFAMLTAVFLSTAMAKEH